MPSRAAWLQALARHAAQRPDSIAVATVSLSGEITRATTWCQLLSAARSRAAVIAHRFPPRATLVSALPSGIELVEWFIASALSGTRLVLMHPRCGTHEFASVCDRTRAAGALAPLALLQHAHPSLVRLIDDAGQPICLPAAPHHESPVEPGEIILSSSGTTGLPKLVLRYSNALDADARAVAAGLELHQRDIILCVPPLCHSYGVDILLGTLFAGAALRIMPEFDALGAARQLRTDVTVLPGVPFVYEALARIHPRDDLSARAAPATPLASATPSLRTAVSAGSPLHPRVRDAFSRLWGIQIGQLYGATELGTVSVHLPTARGFSPDSIGAPLPGVSFRVLDTEDSSRQLPSEQEGQLAVRAPSMLAGYIDADLDLVDGHLLTGDLATIDTHGRATITGRLKLLIDTGGLKVNPLEIEAALLLHPQVAQCAVVPMAMSDTIQRPLAFIVPRSADHPPSVPDLRRFLRERLSPTKIPRDFRLVASLPRTPMGKLLRDQLPTQ
jgi:acyl-CoA synthetase (AMP-forming)/AMP-acid ligase II